MDPPCAEARGALLLFVAIFCLTELRACRFFSALDYRPAIAPLASLGLSGVQLASSWGVRRIHADVSRGYSCKIWLELQDMAGAAPRERTGLSTSLRRVTPPGRAQPARPMTERCDGKANIIRRIGALWPSNPRAGMRFAKSGRWIAPPCERDGACRPCRRAMGEQSLFRGEAIDAVAGTLSVSVICRRQKAGGRWTPRGPLGRVGRSLRGSN